MPPTPQRTPALDRLIEALDGVCAAPMPGFGAGLRDALARLATDAGLLTPAQRAASVAGYARHVLHADPAGRYTVVSLVWDTGQFSPVHAHYTWCGYVVVDGELLEERFRWDASGERAVKVDAGPARAGVPVFGHAGLDAIHRLGNPHATPTVSIHVYGVDGPRVATHVNRLLQPAVAA